MMFGVPLHRLLAITLATSVVMSGLGAGFFASTRELTVSGIELWWTFFLFAFFTVIAAGGFVRMLHGMGRLALDMHEMANNTTDEAGWCWWRMGFNPFNGLFMPKYLNDSGIAARRRSFSSLLVFLTGFGTGVASYYALTALVPTQ